MRESERKEPRREPGEGARIRAGAAPVGKVGGPSLSTGVATALFLLVAALLHPAPLPGPEAASVRGGGHPPPPPPGAVAPAPSPAADAAAARPGSGAGRRTPSSLRRDVDGILDDAGGPSARWSVLAVSLDRGDTLMAVEPGARLAPASNMKLFTTAAALHHLGPDFRFSTYLVSGAPVVDGVLQGDLVLYGTGDPAISDRFHPEKTTVFGELAAGLADAGIRRVAGDVVGDASYFQGPPAPEDWARENAADWFTAPATALAFNENIVTLHLRPGLRDGAPPRVEMIPPGGEVPVVNDGRTAGRGRRARLAVRRTGIDAPVRISGTIPRGNRGVWRRVAVPDPARYAAAVFRHTLEGRGIPVDGGVRSVRGEDGRGGIVGGDREVFAPAFRREPRVLAVHRSPPLSTILAVVNGESNNHFAEAVFRTLGRTVMGDGSHAGGAAAVHAFLVDEVGLDPDDVRQVDGSGLSPGNRASAGSVVALLAHIERSPHWEAYWSTLPEAGSRYGLRRMYRTAAARNLRAKTGTLERASALSGYVRTGDGEHVAFSILSNDVSSTWRAKRAEDRIGARLAAFRRGDGAAVASDRDWDGAIGTHRVRPGETLSVIALRYGVPLASLRRANPGIDPDRIRVGQEIRIP